MKNHRKGEWRREEDNVDSNKIEHGMERKSSIYEFHLNDANMLSIYILPFHQLSWYAMHSFNTPSYFFSLLGAPLNEFSMRFFIEKQWTREAAKKQQKGKAKQI